MTGTRRIATAEQFDEWAQRGDASVFLIDRDGEPEHALIWSDEDGNWHGIRAVSEDDGPWAELPDATRTTLAVPVRNIEPCEDAGAGFTPFTVLWHDGAPDDVDVNAAARAMYAEFNRPVDLHVCQQVWDAYTEEDPTRERWLRLARAALNAHPTPPAAPANPGGTR